LKCTEARKAILARGHQINDTTKHPKTATIKIRMRQLAGKWIWLWCH